MSISRKKLLSELNKDLEWEYAAAIQYVQHAGDHDRRRFRLNQEGIVDPRTARDATCGDAV